VDGNGGRQNLQLERPHTLGLLPRGPRATIPARLGERIISPKLARQAELPLGSFGLPIWPVAMDHRLACWLRCASIGATLGRPAALDGRRVQQTGGLMAAGADPGQVMIDCARSSGSTVARTVPHGLNCELGGELGGELGSELGQPRGRHGKICCSLRFAPGRPPLFQPETWTRASPKESRTICDPRPQDTHVMAPTLADCPPQELVVAAFLVCGLQGVSIHWGPAQKRAANKSIPRLCWTLFPLLFATPLASIRGQKSRRFPLFLGSSSLRSPSCGTQRGTTLVLGPPVHWPAACPETQGHHRGRVCGPIGRDGAAHSKEKGRPRNDQKQMEVSHRQLAATSIGH